MYVLVVPVLGDRRMGGTHWNSLITGLAPRTVRNPVTEISEVGQDAQCSSLASMHVHACRHSCIHMCAHTIHTRITHAHMCTHPTQKKTAILYI